MSKYKYRATFSFEGKRYEVYSNESKTDLEIKKALKIKELEEKGSIINSDITLSEWAYKCVDAYKTNLSKKALNAYRSSMKTGILNYMGDKKLNKIRQIDCQRCLNNLQGKSQFTINYTFQIMNFLFERAIGDNLISTNPAKYCTKPKGEKTVRRDITEEERRLFLELIPTDRRFNMYLLMLACGCRSSEATEVKGEDIVFLDKKPMLHIKGTKSENADRIVPIPKYAYDIIKDIPKNEYVACTSTGNHIADYYQKRVWNRMKREMHIKMGGEMKHNQVVNSLVASDLVPYCLRHTYCTDLARSGVDIRTAQKLMGHSDISLTANIYTHIDNTAIIEAAKILYDN